MATRSELRDEVRRRVGESATAFFTDDDIDDLLNEAQRRFASTQGVLEANRGFGLVANQHTYTPPSNFINMRYVMYDEDTKLRYATQRELLEDLQMDPNQKGEPEYYGIWEREIRVFPTPDTSAASTALDGGISGTDTTITVDSTDSFPVAGRIIINNEEIQYYDTNATQFLQCVRGQAGTTAATHSDNDTVTYANLRMFYYKTPTAMSSDTDEPDIQAEYHDALIYYAASWLKAKDQQFTEAQVFESKFREMRRQALGEIKLRQRDRNPRMLPGDRGDQTRFGRA